MIGLLAAARRAFVLLAPLQGRPRFAAAAAMDGGFAQHKALTLAHILPASLFLALMPVQFVRRIRERHIGCRRWSGRLLVALGFVVGISALALSYTSSIGGANETAANVVRSVFSDFPWLRVLEYPESPRRATPRMDDQGFRSRARDCNYAPDRQRVLRGRPLKTA